jgi:ankyrin repeat protein
MIDLISKKGADPNHRCGYDHFTPLMALSSLGRGRVDDRLHGEIMKGFRFLLQIPTIDVNLLDEYGNALIQRVVVMEDPAFLTMLLEKRASREHINKTGMMGLSPLHLACSSRLVSIESIRSLLDKGADPYQPSRTEEGYPPLYYAIKTYGENVNLDMDKLRDILDIFLRHGVDIGRHRGGDGGTIMHVVARYANDARFCTKVLNNGGG